MNSNDPTPGGPQLSRRAVVATAAATPLALSGVLASADRARADDKPKAGAPAHPFGPNFHLFDPSMPAADIQKAVDEIFKAQETNQFGERRDAIAFLPGDYEVTVTVGFNTQVLGTGLLPGQTRIKGHVTANADWWSRTPWAGDNPTNATQNFWRGAENLQVTPTGGMEMWAVSQAAPYRRMHIVGDLELAQHFKLPSGQEGYGWTSGGLLADSVVDGMVWSRTQQQWLTRNSRVSQWQGQNWNHLFLGSVGCPGNTFPNPPYTAVERTPSVREKPFLHIKNGAWQVFVPALRSNTRGESWTATSAGPGSSLPISKFHITQPGESAASMNAALAKGKHLLVTPGVYSITEPIRVTRADTVVLGIGMATLHTAAGNLAIQVDSVPGVRIAGLLVDAGEKESPKLVEIGKPGHPGRRTNNPISMHDLYLRVGGPSAAHAVVSLEVNARDVIGDHLWVWRADHGDVDPNWTNVTGRNGVIVNGDDVTMYGLFVEHYQEFQTIWNGEGGRTYFYQNETPYDPPKQSDWMDGKNYGWAAYKVSDKVKRHEAWALGSYAVFTKVPTVPDPVTGKDKYSYSPQLTRSFEVPTTRGVKMHSMTTVSIVNGPILNVVNDKGGPTGNGNVSPVRVVSYP